MVSILAPRSTSRLWIRYSPVILRVDDVLIHGRDEEEHDTHLRKVLDRAREVNMGLNGDKCKFYRTEVAYVGHVISEEGVKPDPDKIRTIIEPEYKVIAVVQISPKRLQELHTATQADPVLSREDRM
jgi:hypothetical protein